MNVLFTAFNGKTNSSKILLDLIKIGNKLYLKNSFKTSVEQFVKEINRVNYDIIISFGQAPLKNDNIKIETIGKGEDTYITNYEYASLERLLKLNSYKVIISNDAGNYLCNNIYYNGLKYIEGKKLKTKMIFIHIPNIDNISDMDKLASIFNKGSDIYE